MNISTKLWHLKSDGACLYLTNKISRQSVILNNRPNVHKLAAMSEKEFNSEASQAFEDKLWPKI